MNDEPLKNVRIGAMSNISQRALRNEKSTKSMNLSKVLIIMILRYIFWEMLNVLINTYVLCSTDLIGSVAREATNSNKNDELWTDGMLSEPRVAFVHGIPN